MSRSRSYQLTAAAELAAGVFECRIGLAEVRTGSAAGVAIAVTPVANEVQDGYWRSLFSEGIDADGDVCPTRADVLIRSSTTPAQTSSRCEVVAGPWLSPHGGLTYSDPSQLEVDHVVSVKEA